MLFFKNDYNNNIVFYKKTLKKYTTLVFSAALDPIHRHYKK